MMQHFHLVFRNRLLPLAAVLENLAENKVESWRHGTALEGALGIPGCLGQLSLLHLSAGKIDELVGIAAVDMDRAIQIAFGFREFARAIIRVTEVIVGGPEPRIALEDAEVNADRLVITA